jgi:peptidoglycan/xylan/chitin deacetylase (PgdA/CDA1 family)
MDYLLPETGNIAVDNTENNTPTFTTQPSITVLPSATPMNNNNFGKDMDYPETKQASGTVRIPVLTYHHIATLPSNMLSRDYYVSPAQFEIQMAYLKSKNYKTIAPKEFYDLLKAGKNPTQKTVMITFDDGNVDNYLNAFPILKKYNFVGVFYIPSLRSGINKARLQEMVKAGMAIEDHGATHVDLKAENVDANLRKEIVNSKLVIEAMTGKKVYSIAYPGCVYDAQAFTFIKAAGYILGFSCGKSIDHKPGNYFSLSRIHVYNDLEDFKKRLSGIWEYPAGYSSN